MTLEEIDLKAWSAVEDLVKPIRSKKRYNKLVGLVYELLDEIGSAKKHPLLPMLDTLSLLIEEYEDREVIIPDVEPVEMVKFFMEEHGLTQSELPEIGPQSIVSEVLRGKRELNLRQVKALAKRFNVSTDTFV